MNNSRIELKNFLDNIELKIDYNDPIRCIILSAHSISLPMDNMMFASRAMHDCIYASENIDEERDWQIERFCEWFSENPPEPFEI